VASITLTSGPAVAAAGDVLVVGVAKSAKGPVLAGAGAGAAGQPLRALAGSLGVLGVTGALESVCKVAAPAGVTAPLVLLVGLGEQHRTYDGDTLRRAAGAAARALTGSSRVVLGLPAGSAAEVEAVALGALLGAYTFTEFRTKSADSAREGVRSLVLASALDAKAARAAVARAKAIGQAVCLARDLVNTPPNILTPRAFADRASREASALGLAISVLDEKALRRGGYGGITGVGQGSVNPPRLVRLAYRHPKATQHLALVGKGITFDTGGISIKPAGGMELMKSDMGGAAAVLGAMTAVARLKPVVNVTGWAPMAENMPGGGAQRPSDVLTTYGGRTVEVLNTDAEGRLVLADAIVAALEDHPDVIVDVATLTGAQRVALGARISGIMSNDDGLRDQIHAASKRVGESMWPMPLPEELRAGLDSSVADIANVDNGRLAGMLSGGTFLREFVPAGQPWAHLDIAGPAYNGGGGYGFTPSGATGASVRTLVELAEELAAGRLG
jgi:leucyl aminopeptidase